MGENEHEVMRCASGDSRTVEDIAGHDRSPRLYRVAAIEIELIYRAGAIELDGHNWADSYRERSMIERCPSPASSTTKV